MKAVSAHGALPFGDSVRALVTGGAGFIGSHVAERLLRRHLDVLVVDDLSGGFRDNIPEGARFEQRSVLDPLDDLFQRYKPELVYHLAAYAAEGLSHHIPTFNYTNNVVGTASVLAAAQRAGVEHFVFTSSIAAYGHAHDGAAFTEDSAMSPIDPYGIAKLACEQHIRATQRYFGGPSFTIFRPHNVFGPRQNIADPYRNVVGIFMACALTGRPMPVFGDGSQSRNFSYIDVVAEAIARAPDIPKARNCAFNIGGDQAMSVRQLALEVARVMNVAPRLEHMPPRLEVQHAHCEHALARSVFGDIYREYEIDIASGLRLMAAHVQKQALPETTECPAPIEVAERLPPAWAARLKGT